jgi:hypothetical protein
MFVMRYRRRIAWFAVLGLLGLGLGLQACSKEERADPERPAETIGTTTSTTVDQAALVLSAYNAGWDAYVFFGSPEGLSSPDLAGLSYPEQFDKVFRDVVTDDQYRALFDSLQAIRADSEFRGGRAAVENRVRVVSLVGDEATLRDCYDDNLQTWSRRTQARLDQDDPNRHLIEVRMVRKDGRWKAAKATRLGDGCTDP